MSFKDPAETRLRAQIAAHSKWASTPDRTSATAPARAALEAKFLAEAGGDVARAQHLRKAYYLRLALKSAQSRRKAKELIVKAVEAEAELELTGGDAA